MYSRIDINNCKRRVVIGEGFANLDPVLLNLICDIVCVSTGMKVTFFKVFLNFLSPYLLSLLTYCYCSEHAGNKKVSTYLPLQKLDSLKVVRSIYVVGLC